MSTKVWKGFLNFGLLSIPVYLNVGARDKKLELNTFHTACNGRIKMPKWCPSCSVMLEPTETYRGYDSGSGIVKLTDEEMESITPTTEKVMEISECVEWKDVDPLYLAESFYVLPDDAGRKAYGLLTKTLMETGRATNRPQRSGDKASEATRRKPGCGLQSIAIRRWLPATAEHVDCFEAG